MKPCGQCPAPLGSHMTVVRSVSSAVMMLTYLCPHSLLDETTWTVSSSTGQLFDCGEVSFRNCDDVDLLVYLSSLGWYHVDYARLKWTTLQLWSSCWFNVTLYLASGVLLDWAVLQSTLHCWEHLFAVWNCVLEASGFPPGVTSASVCRFYISQGLKK